MGKIAKAVAVKKVDGTEKESKKVKKLANTPGVVKAKLNLKETRVSLKKILQNKSEVVGQNVASVIKATEPIKTKKKKLSKPVGNSIKTKSGLKIEIPVTKPGKNKSDSKVEVPTMKPLKRKSDSKVEIPIMKPLKRKADSENIVKLPLPKKKGIPPVVATKKQTKKKPVEELESEKNPEIEKKEDEEIDGEIDGEISTEDLESQPKKTDAMTIDKSQVVKGVSAVLKLAKLQAESKKTLFDGEHQPIFLQVSCIKVPKVPTRQLRMMLPHTLVTDTDDVALFVCDLKKGRAQDFEPTINHYEEILRENNCTQIKDVIPLTQVKTEYDQYELKRKLLSSYDYFLTDGKIAGHMSHLLGKIFTTKRKLPTSVRMDSKNLKQEIDNALKKTSMQLHSHGNSHIIQVAHTAMKKHEILNNILNVSKNLARNYPGGWINIRSLILKTPTSLPVPIYITLKSKNKVKVPVTLPTRPKAYRTVSGELSTAPGNAKAVVRPDGTVTVQYRDKRNKKDGKSPMKKSKLTTDKSAAKKSKGIKKKATATKDVTENVGIKKNDEPASVSPEPIAQDSEDISESTVTTTQKIKPKAKSIKEKNLKTKSKVTKKRKTKA